MPISRDLSRQPHGYMLPMEVLATIPVAAPVPLEWLAGDFRLTMRQTRSVLHKLIVEMGYGLLIENKAVKLDPKSLSRTNADLEDYWARVHERPQKTRWYQPA